MPEQVTMATDPKHKMHIKTSKQPCQGMKSPLFLRLYNKYALTKVFSIFSFECC